MSRIKFAQLTEMKTDELVSTLSSARKELMAVRLSNSDSQAEKSSRVHSVKNARKKVARVLTALNVLKK
ncbi:MAG: 50S ribosomal protein L29 [Alphaproteobacteria bacterium]|nr:50S ribosomal protein L29 [Rickettsiales bacterium]